MEELTRHIRRCRREHDGNPYHNANTKNAYAGIGRSWKRTHSTLQKHIVTSSGSPGDEQRNASATLYRVCEIYWARTVNATAMISKQYRTFIISTTPLPFALPLPLPLSKNNKSLTDGASSSSKLQCTRIGQLILVSFYEIYFTERVSIHLLCSREPMTRRTYVYDWAKKYFIFS